MTVTQSALRIPLLWLIFEMLSLQNPHSANIDPTAFWPAEAMLAQHQQATRIWANI